MIDVARNDGALQYEDRAQRNALDDIRARGERVVPLCPFVAAYIERHPGEYDDLVA